MKVTSEEDLIAAMGAITFVTANTVPKAETFVPKAVPEAANVVLKLANVVPEAEIVVLKPANCAQI